MFAVAYVYPVIVLAECVRVLTTLQTNVVFCFPYQIIIIMELASTRGGNII